MQEKENVIDILERTKGAVKEGNILLLKDLSNRTVHTASIYADPDNIAVAVAVYSLGKILEREKYKEYRQWNSFIKGYLACLDKALIALRGDDLESFRQEIEHINGEISRLSGNFRVNIQQVFRKAMINKASRIYEHGISMQKTAKLLGISIWELAEYSGQTGISNVNLSITLDVKERIKNAMEFLTR